MQRPGQRFARFIAIAIAIACTLAPVAIANGQARGDGGGAKRLWRSLFKRPRSVEPPPSAARRREIALGEQLFVDKRISRDQTRSCATCHRPALGFTDGQSRAASRSPGVKLRNVPTLYGTAFAKRLNWDGSAQNLGAQLLRPVASRHELDGSLHLFARRLNEDPASRRAFAATYGTPPNADRIVDALVAFQTSLTPPRTRFDAWVDGDDDALDPRELKGFDIFTGKGACVTCHRGWRFTDDKLHDIGLPGPTSAPFAFKTPTLRELSQTAPFMHDGRFDTLAQVLQHYRNGVEDRPTLSQNMRPRPHLTEDDIAALEAFLLTLSSASEPNR